MRVAVLAVAFLYVATILGLFLPATEAEINARNFKPPTDDSDDHGHDSHGHSSHH